ncbi:MAG: hypothetical protein CM15mP84_00260 [Cellvibrionales bacterium]|nr:MAG: hypothetical protein CM15mP84_00260 [Cellvibrionales bacterium]
MPTADAEKSLRLQNDDLEIDYNLYEAGLSRPKVKAADFHGKDATSPARVAEQAAYLCTFVLEGHHRRQGCGALPRWHWPLLDPESKEVIIDSHGRRSYTTSVAFGPSLARTSPWAILPADRAKEGDSVLMEYFGCFFPAKIVSVGYRALLDPTTNGFAAESRTGAYAPFFSRKFSRCDPK